MEPCKIGKFIFLSFFFFMLSGCTIIMHPIHFELTPQDERPKIEGTFLDNTMGFGDMEFFDDYNKETFSGTYKTINPSGHGFKKRIVEMKGDKGSELRCRYKFNFKLGHTAAMIAWGAMLGARMPEYYGEGSCEDNQSRPYSITVSSTKEGLHNPPNLEIDLQEEK